MEIEITLKVNFDKLNAEEVKAEALEQGMTVEEYLKVSWEIFLADNYFPLNDETCEVVKAKVLGE